MDLLQEPSFFGESMESFFTPNWCSCTFSSICSFDETPGGCTWIGGECAFGGNAVCNYPESCGNTLPGSEKAE